MRSFPFFLLITFASPAYSQLYQADTILLLMGSRYEITAVHEDQSLVKKSIGKAVIEIQRIESLISSWKPESQTSKINQAAGLFPVKVDMELLQLIERSLKVSALTKGHFNIAFGPLGELWNYCGKENRIPSTVEIDSAMRLINSDNIVVDKLNRSVFLKEKGMKIGFGAIGKGYSANKARQVMEAMGINNGMVNAGGDLTIWGNSIDKVPWKIGLADPDKKASFIAWLELTNTSIVTSGNYEKFIEINGKKYTHIINPLTGIPAEGVKSVTVISPDAELSDALATAVFVMGTEKGIELINKLKNTECLVIDDQNKYWQSKGLNLNFY